MSLLPDRSSPLRLTLAAAQIPPQQIDARRTGHDVHLYWDNINGPPSLGKSRFQLHSAFVLLTHSGLQFPSLAYETWTMERRRAVTWSGSSTSRRGSEAEVKRDSLVREPGTFVSQFE